MINVERKLLLKVTMPNYGNTPLTNWRQFIVKIALIQGVTVSIQPIQNPDPVESGTFPLIPTDLAKKKKLRGLFF